VIHRSFGINVGEIGNSWKLLGRSGTYGRYRKSTGDTGGSGTFRSGQVRSG
jgi:hypothetical protein